MGTKYVKFTRRLTETTTFCSIWDNICEIFPRGGMWEENKQVVGDKRVMHGPWHI